MPVAFVDATYMFLFASIVDFPKIANITLLLGKVISTLFKADTRLNTLAFSAVVLLFSSENIHNTGNKAYSYYMPMLRR